MAVCQTKDSSSESQAPTVIAQPRLQELLVGMQGRQGVCRKQRAAEAATIPRDQHAARENGKGWVHLYRDPTLQPAIVWVPRSRAQPALGQCSLFSWKPVTHTTYTTSSGIKPTGIAKHRQPQAETGSCKPCSSILGKPSSTSASDLSGALDLPNMEQQQHGPPHTAPPPAASQGHPQGEPR